MNDAYASTSMVCELNHASANTNSYNVHANKKGPVPSIPLSKEIICTCM